MEYAIQRQNRLLQQQENLWTCAIGIYHSVRREDCMASFFASYERFAKVEPNFYISKARFLFWLRQIFVKEKFLRNGLFFRNVDVFFENLVYEKNKVNWRALFLVIFALHNPKWSFRDIMIQALSLLFGDGSRDCSSMEYTGRIKISWFFDLVDPFIQVEAKTSFVDNIYDALFTDAKEERKGRLETNLKPFLRILDHKLLADLCDKRQLWRVKGISADLSDAEMRYYCAPFKKYLQTQRHEIRLNTFFSQTISRRKKMLFNKWKRFAWKRKKAILLLRRVLSYKASQICSAAFQIFVRYAIRSIAAQEIQSLVRCAIGKMELRFRSILFSAAVFIQSMVRSHAQRKMISSLCRHRIVSATKIQSSIRRLFSRRVLINRLLTFIDEERKLLAQQRKAWMERRQYLSALVIQKTCRMLKGKSIRKAIKDKQMRELIAAEDIEKIQRAYKLERVFKQIEVEQYYESRRLEWLRKNKERNDCDRVKLCIDRIRRRYENDEATRKKEDDVLKLKEASMEKIKEEIQQLKIAAVAKSEDFRENFLRKCLENPEVRDEYKKGAEIKKTIKNRVKALLTSRDVKMQFMEKPELYQVAKNEILCEMEEEEKFRLLSELKVEEGRLYQSYINLQNEIIDARERQAILQIARANKAVFSAFRLMKARKRFREECQNAYEKRFDTKYHCYYYLHRRTGEVSWEKPKVFGNAGFDIEPTEEWIVMRDPQEFPYYYNCKTMKMCWERPSDVEICQNTILYTWWKLHPFPSGQCYNLATKRSDEDELLYCEDCCNSQSGRSLLKDN